MTRRAAAAPVGLIGLVGLVGLAGLVALTACSVPRLPGLPGAERAVAPPCPNVMLPGDTAALTRFLPGPGRDITDIVLEVRITNFVGECETEFEERNSVAAGGTVAVGVNIEFLTERGPAHSGDVGEFVYFVAILDDRDRILAKEVYPVAVRFPIGRNRLRPIDTVFQDLELAPGEIGADYNIVIGLQLSDAELRDNRDRR